MLVDLLIRFLIWCSRHTPPRVITGVGEDKDTPYLTRYFLFRRRGPTTEGMEHDGPPPKWGLYLHHFHRGDLDRELHNHPWAWAYSLVLKNGYSEERRGAAHGNRFYPRCAFPGCCDKVTRRIVRPWTLNRISANDFHRVDLPFGEAWTLFLVGPVVQSWGFWDRNTRVFTPWKKFLGIE